MNSISKDETANVNYGCVFYVGIPEKLCEGAIIMIHDQIDPEIDSFPDFVLVTVIRSGRCSLPIGGPVTVEHLKRHLLSKNLRSTSIFSLLHWARSDAPSDNISEVQFIVRPWENTVEHVNATELFFGPLKTTGRSGEAIPLPMPILRQTFQEFINNSDNSDSDVENRARIRNWINNLAPLPAVAASIEAIPNPAGTRPFRTTRPATTVQSPEKIDSVPKIPRRPAQIYRTHEKIVPIVPKKMAIQTISPPEREILWTRHGSIAIFFGPLHTEINHCPSEYSVASAVAMLKDCVAHRPKMIVRDGKTIETIPFIIELWQYLRAECPEIAYSIIGLICMHESDVSSSSSTERTLLRMICSSAMIYRGRPAGHVSARECMTAIVRAYEFPTRPSYSFGVSSERFIHLLAGELWNRYVKLSPLNLHGNYGNVAYKYTAVPKDDWDHLYVERYTISRIALEIHENNLNLARIDDRIARFGRADDYPDLNDGLQAAGPDVAVPIVAPISRIVPEVCGETICIPGLKILRQRSGELIAVRGDLDAGVRAITVKDSIRVESVTWTVGTSIPNDRYRWHLYGMTAPRGRIHVRVRDILKDILGIIKNDAGPASVFGNAIAAVLTFGIYNEVMDLTTFNFDTKVRIFISAFLFAISWLASAAVHYVGNGKFSVDNGPLLYRICSEILANVESPVGIPLASAGPLVSVVWFHGKNVVDFLVAWALHFDAVIFCPPEAISAIRIALAAQIRATSSPITSSIFDFETARTINCGSRPFVLLEPCRVSVTTRDIILSKTRFCRGMVVGEFVVNIESWIPWLSMTLPKFADPVERLIQCSVGNPTSVLPTTISAGIVATVRDIMTSTNLTVLVVMKRHADLLAAVEDLSDYSPSFRDCRRESRLFFARPSGYSGFPLEKIDIIIASDLSLAYKFQRRCRQAENENVRVMYTDES